MIIKRGPFKFKIWANEIKKVVVAKIVTAMQGGFHLNIEHQSIIGKAKCNPEDTFKLDLGIQIAVDRALFYFTNRYLKGLERERSRVIENMKDNLSDVAGEYIPLAEGWETRIGRK